MRNPDLLGRDIRGFLESQRCGTQGCGYWAVLVVGGQLHWMTLEIFSNLSDSMILLFSWEGRVCPCWGLQYAEPCVRWWVMCETASICVFCQIQLGIDLQVMEMLQPTGMVSKAQ